MSERPTLAVGLMSGTSLDGMDAALVRINDPTHVDLVAFTSRPYEAHERQALLAAIASARAPELARLHVQLAHWAGDAVDAVLAAAGIGGADLGLIAFHGQTIWHEPPLVTWQLGEAAVLAERFGVRVVHNFRARDVAAGGQGAPLVPMADVLLFGAEHPRVLLNIGGMANLTYVPRRADDEGAFAFDTGPGMAVIDALARHVRPDLPFDRDGVVSGAGTVNELLLAKLLADPYFLASPPKSTGRERYGEGYAREIAERCPGPDGVALAVALTARTVAAAVQRWARGAEVVVSGGGARHPGLMRALAAALGAARESPSPLLHFDDLFFDGDAKEAVAFALLGYLTIHGQPGNVPRATGARGARVLGSVTPA
ncbi:MAG TPA: anhydro-N-acetylmuramic acid kinase [Gemmatimonadales bacterium]|nr:anhydro-N-acetylmuramic acid kinase [Gemmatimonadales bacterium]